MRNVEENILRSTIIRRNVIGTCKFKAVLNKESIMDFDDIEGECSSANVAHTCENRFSQDTQYRPRKSPHKKLKVSRTSASLVIDQLKSVFRRPGDFMPRMRTRRNWRPEFLMKYFRDNRCDCNGECNAVVSQHGKRSFVPEAPKIYSIGLNSGVRSFSDTNDLSSPCGTTRSFRKRFNIVRRSTIKYWTAQSTSSLPINASLKEYASRQMMTIDGAKSSDILKNERSQRDRDNPSYEQVERESNMSIVSRDDRVAGFFILDKSNDTSVKRGKFDKSCLTKDAGIQTSSRRSSRRKRTKKRSTNEGISRHKRRDDESHKRILADFRVDDPRDANGRCHHEKSRQCIRFLEGKRAEYINKFTAVNRQIEEITATLKETGYGGKSSPNNLKNCEEYFDDAKINAGEKSKESKFVIARSRLKRRDDFINVERRIIGESENDRLDDTREALQVDNIINNKTPDSSRKNYPRNIITTPMCPDRRDLNDIFTCDPIRASSIKETIHSSNEISKNKREARCRLVKRISFDLDLTKDGAELQEFPIADEPFDDVHLRNNLVITVDEYAKGSAENFVVSEESRYRKKIVEEKLGEIAILEDIKKRIDRDFDDPSAGKSETGTDDFLTVSQKSSNFDHNLEVSMSSIVSGSLNLEFAETQICDSFSTMSEQSNKNSIHSKYFSCTQFPSLISLIEDENELERLPTVIARDSHSDLHSSDPNYCDHSHTNYDSSHDRSHVDLEYAARAARRVPRDKFLVRTLNGTNDTFEISGARDDFAESEICLLGERTEAGSRVDFERRRAIDSMLETSKSSRYIGSIDSGVFSSSLIDLYPLESSLDIGRSKMERCRRGKRDSSSPVADFTSDDSCNDDALDRKVNDVVRDLTRNLILCERRARTKLREMRKVELEARDSPYSLSRSCKFNEGFYDTYRKFFISPRFSEDESIAGISTPSFLSLSDSEIEDRESKCRLCVDG